MLTYTVGWGLKFNIDSIFVQYSLFVDTDDVLLCHNLGR